MTAPPKDPPATLADGRYRVERVLGMGGMSVVLLAHDTRMGVDRAIKLLYQRIAGTPQVRERFENEARAQARLRHPNILMVHDVVEEDLGLYLVMELAEAGNLAQRVRKEGVLSPRETARVGAVLAGALAVAHADGVIHRDVKPENVLIDRYGNLKIADFGIARVVTARAELTGTGMAMGTWAYMPPEQRESARQVDGRADVYALGASLYFLVAGRQPPALHNTEAYDRYFAGFPQPLAAVIQKATRLYPEDRYQSCGELEAALLAILDSLSDDPVPGFHPDETHDPPVTGVEEALDLAAITRANPDAAHTLLPLFSTAGSQGAAPSPEEPEADDAAPATSPVRVPALLLAAVGVALVVLPAVLILPRMMSDEEHEPPPATEAQAGPRPQIASPPGDEVPRPPPAPTADEESGGAGAPAPDRTPSRRRSASTGATTSGGTETGGATATTGAASRGGPRIITVAPTSGAPEALDLEEDISRPPAEPMGLLVVRTVPSGAQVWSGGVQLQRDGRGYPLAVGRHLLELRSTQGESTRIPLSIRDGEVVDICYSFDTNSACDGAR